jgi:hypothetical protein
METIARIDAAAIVQAELLDKQNQVLPGFSRSDCLPFTGDSTRHLLRWKQREFSPETARAVKKIRFYLKNADLYSYRPKELDTDRDQGNREAR